MRTAQHTNDQVISRYPFHFPLLWFPYKNVIGCYTLHKDIDRFIVKTPVCPSFLLTIVSWLLTMFLNNPLIMSLSLVYWYLLHISGC